MIVNILWQLVFPQQEAHFIPFSFYFKSSILSQMKMNSIPRNTFFHIQTQVKW